MKPPCIMILMQDSLLKRAVVSIMDAGRDLEVVVSEALDIIELAEDVLKIKPDALLMGESMPMAGSDSLFHLQNVCPKLRMIVVSENSNWLHIFGERYVLLNSPVDLIDSITLS